MEYPIVVVVNESTVISDSDVKDLVEALQMQVDNEFVGTWHLRCELLFQDKTQPIETGEWQLVILDNSDQAGALGYHEMTVNGDPLGKVFAGDDLKFGTNWTVTASHELLEMLGDPWINLCAQIDENTFYAYETCDACESDDYGYGITIASGKVVVVSDFVTPEWFQPQSKEFPLDFKGHIAKPLEILQDGYIGVFRDGKWNQLAAEFSSPEVEARSIPKEGHRRHRRALSRSEWRKSDVHR